MIAYENLTSPTMYAEQQVRGAQLPEDAIDQIEKLRFDSWLAAQALLEIRQDPGRRGAAGYDVVGTQVLSVFSDEERQQSRDKKTTIVKDALRVAKTMYEPDMYLGIPGRDDLDGKKLVSDEEHRDVLNERLTQILYRSVVSRVLAEGEK